MKISDDSKDTKQRQSLKESKSSNQNNKIYQAPFPNKMLKLKFKNLRKYKPC